MTFGGGSGGAGSISGSNDVALNNTGNSQVLSYDSAAGKWRNSTANQVIIRYDTNTSSWPDRPVNAPLGVLYLSTNSVTASAPDDVNLVAGDRWLRHPNAS